MSCGGLFLKLSKRQPFQGHLSEYCLLVLKHFSVSHKPIFSWRLSTSTVHANVQWPKTEDLHLQEIRTYQAKAKVKRSFDMMAEVKHK